MVRSPAASPKQRVVQLRRLATLLHEVAILRGKQGRGDLAAAATTCRQLLVTYPDHRDEADTWLLLARVELRRGDHRAVLDATKQLSSFAGSQQRCEGWLLAATAQTARSAHDEAIALYRLLLADQRCRRDRSLTDEASYLLGWSLIRSGKTSKAAQVFKRLLSRELVPLLRQRVLNDLALAWSAERPDRSAASMLVQLGGSQHGWLLVRQVAERLLAQGRTPVLQRFVARALKLDPPLDMAAALWKLRLRATKRAAGLLSLLAQLRNSSAKLHRRLRSHAAATLLRLAEGLEDNKALYQAVVRDYPEQPAAAVAHEQLGELARQRSNFAEAAKHFNKAATLASSEPLRQRARYQHVYCLEQLLAEDPSLSLRFCKAAALYLREHAAAAEASTVRLALASEHLARGRATSALALAMQTPAGWAIATAAAERLERWALVHKLSTEKLEHCHSDEPGAPIHQDATNGTSCVQLRQRAHAAALRRSAQLAAEAPNRPSKPDAARKWAERAAKVAPTPAARWIAERLAAQLAMRGGAAGEADALLKNLLTGRIKRSQWVAVATTRADLAQALGRFRDAAQHYGAAADRARTLAARLDLLARSARAWLHARQRPRASRAIRRLRLSLKKGAAGLTPVQQARWALRAGQLLSRCDRRQAYRWLLRSAHNLPPRFSRSVARLLLAAANNAPSAATGRSLLRRAISFAGPLKRRGVVSSVAVDAALRWAAARRSTLKARRPSTTILTRFAASLAPLLQLRDPRRSPEAASHLAWAFGAIADSVEQQADEPAAPDATATVWRTKQRRVQQQLAMLARRPGGLSAFSLAATRGTLPRLVDGLDESTNTAAKSMRSLLRRGRWQAALAASEKALALFGGDATLHCARSVALLVSDRPHAAWQELAAAVRLDPTSRCARSNLIALGRRRGNLPLAKQLIDRARDPGEPTKTAFFRGELTD